MARGTTDRPHRLGRLVLRQPRRHLVDKLLDEKIARPDDATKQGWLESLKGKAAIANAKIAYAVVPATLLRRGWDALAAAGAHVQRPLWASTSSRTRPTATPCYVDELIGPDTVNTMPRPTIAAFLDHGTVERTVDKDVAGAYKTMEDLAAAASTSTPSPRSSKTKASPRSSRATTHCSRASPPSGRNWRARQRTKWAASTALRSTRYVERGSRGCLTSS